MRKEKLARRLRGVRNLDWQKFDPDEYIWGALNRLPSRRQALAWGSLFVTLKWASFASSVNDLIIQSKPIKWLAHYLVWLIERDWPAIHPLFAQISYILSVWTKWWRDFVSPLYRLLSLFRFFHVPEIFVAISTDLLVLFLLPMIALVGSFVTSRALRSEVSRLRSEFDTKINQIGGQDILAARKLRAAEWMQIYGHSDELSFLGTVLLTRAIKNRQGKLATLSTAKPSPTVAIERQRIQDEITRLQNKDNLEWLSEASPDELRSALNDTQTLGTKPIFMSRTDLNQFLDYMQGKHLGFMFSDPETVDKNLRLLHAQLGINFQVFRAVGLSLILAIAAVALRIIGQIWL